jgi:hypothetical protein
MRRLRQLGALLALLALVAGVPWVMSATIGNPLHGWADLKVGDLSDTVVIDILAGIVWLAWAQFAVSVVTATGSALRRGLHGSSLPGRGLAGPRVPGEFTGIPHLARTLVAAALLIGATTAAVATPVRAFAADPAPAPSAVTAAAHLNTAPARPAPTVNESRPRAANPVADRHASTQPPAGTTVYVVPHDGAGPDTYWDIAAAKLGNGERWHEIWDLNRGRAQADGSVMTQAALLLPGWTVLIPAPATAGGGDQVIPVVRGDDLTEIAEDHGSTEPAVWARNEGRVMSDGRLFTDPNLIKPGDTIIIPGPATTRGTPAAPTTPGTLRPHTPPVTPTRPGYPSKPGQSDPNATQAPTTPATTTPAPAASSAPSPAAAHHAPDKAVPAARSQSSSWAEVFAGFGAVLAAGLLGVLVLRRRMVWRHARLGHTIESTPPHLIPVEKATLSYGRAAAADGQFLDFALRSLAYSTAGEQGAALPDIVAARMIGDQLELRLAEPHPLPPPAPWRVDDSGLWWSVSAGDELPVSADTAPDIASPYPTLVGVGYAGGGSVDAASAPEGAGEPVEKWLLDLERAGAIALTGDRDRCLELGRFIAAGLAVNDWSHHVSVTMVGFGEELVPINPFRLRYTEDLDSAAELLRAEFEHAVAATGNAGMGVLDGRLHDVAVDSFLPHVLLVAPHIAAEQDHLRHLLDEVAGRPDRAAVAIVLAGDRGDVPGTGWTLDVAADGRLSLPDLGLHLMAQRMPAEQAAGIAEMLERASVGREQPVPPATGDRPYEQYCDAAGGLRPELTLPRSPAPSPMAVPASGLARLARLDRVAAGPETTTLLPADDAAYLAAASTTAEDLQVVAPRVPVEVAEQVTASVGSLDEDLVAWRNPDCPLPRLNVFGPPELRALGHKPPRVAYHTAMAVYLASRDHGAQMDQIAEAFNLKNESAYSRLKDLRAWFGVNPRTGEMHLPDARKSKASQKRGVSVYEIEDLLVDADLFKRLYLRGQASGGDEGIADLEAALELVAGEPYQDVSGVGYEWLIDNPVNEYLKASVEKVAHAIASWALERGELDRAESAARKALDAMPYAEVPRLDLAAVLEARGSKAAAERLLRDEVCNRDDDGNGPMELSERTEQIRRRRAWLSAAG